MSRNLLFSHKHQANASLYHQSPQAFVQRAGTWAASRGAEVGAQTPRFPCLLRATHNSGSSETRAHTWVPSHYPRESAGLQITLPSSGGHRQSHREQRSLYGGRTPGFITVVSSQLGTNPFCSAYGRNFHLSLLGGFPKSPEVVSYLTCSFPSFPNMILHFIFIIIGFKIVRHNALQSREDILGVL